LNLDRDGAKEMDKRMFERESIEPMEIVFEEVQVEDVIYKDVSVYIEDISFEGIRITCNIEFNINTQLHFRMPSLVEDTFIEGHIVWKKALQNEMFQYGLHFSS
jgi:hypothetical protein